MYIAACRIEVGGERAQKQGIRVLKGMIFDCTVQNGRETMPNYDQNGPTREPKRASDLPNGAFEQKYRIFMDFVSMLGLTWVQFGSKIHKNTV